MHIYLGLHVHLHESRRVCDLTEWELTGIFLFPFFVFFILLR